MTLARTRPERARKRLYRRFRTTVDGLIDKATRKAEETASEQFDREWFGGQWQKSHPMSYDLEIVERTSGNPLNTLGRAIDGVHRGEIVSVAIVALGDSGVIHTAWSDGDLHVLSRAAKFLSQDLDQASQ